MQIFAWSIEKEGHKNKNKEQLEEDVANINNEEFINDNFYLFDGNGTTVKKELKPSQDIKISLELKQKNSKDDRSNYGSIDTFTCEVISNDCELLSVTRCVRASDKTYTKFSKDWNYKYTVRDQKYLEENDRWWKTVLNEKQEPDLVKIIDEKANWRNDLSRNNDILITVSGEKTTKVEITDKPGGSWDPLDKAGRLHQFCYIVWYKKDSKINKVYFKYKTELSFVPPPPKK